MKTCARCGAGLKLGARACAACNHPVRALGSPPAVGATATAWDWQSPGPAGTRPPPPKRIADYEVVGEIGEGGMGVVYEVLGADGERYALKRIRHVATNVTVQRFLREGRVLQALEHPNLVAIREFARDAEGPYLVTELIVGESLAQRLERGPLRTREAVALVVALCDAVSFAHEHGVLHRDIKPSNVMLRRGREPVLIDFGLAHFEDDQKITATGALIGTPAFAAPEQLLGPRKSSARSDVFGLGGVLYTALTNRSPNEGSTISELLIQVKTKESRWPTQRLLPLELEEIGKTAIARDPRERYASAAEFGRALRDWVAASS